MSGRTKGLFRQALLDVESAEPMWVCQACLDDYMLKNLNGALQEERVCCACGKTTRSALTPERIARFIREYLPKHFQPDHGLYPGYELTLDDVVGCAIGCSSETLRRAVSACLEDLNAGRRGLLLAGAGILPQTKPF
jgi:hypothetical protein